MINEKYAFAAAVLVAVILGAALFYISGSAPASCVRRMDRIL